ncbi:MAG TPA: c-type cytochrome domain-containing protein [Pirellulales bacterium]|nr:c-type cytochrome domain-containing protein [Pirellulales bacterium]
MRTASTTLAICLLALSGLVAQRATAADATDDAIASINDSLTKAGKAFRDKNAAEAAAALGEAKTTFQAATAGDVSPAMRAKLDALGDRLAAAERAIARLAAPVESKAASAKKSSAKPAVTPTAKTKKPAKARRAAPTGPSFTSDVAPILMAKCGNCHVRGARGGLSMATFAALEKGTRNGPVIRPGSAAESRMIDLVATGQMPKGDNKLTPEELATLSRWIDAGAFFDGDDRTAPLGQKSAGEMEGLVKATGKETVQFSRDLAPVLLEQCARCHGGDNPAGQLRLETFAGLLAGGASGKAIEADKPTESLLLNRLRGIDGDRMPLEKPPLPDEVIARFETWLKEGAKFDGSDATASLRVAVEESLAGRMTHDELTAKRVVQAQKLWALAAPDEASEMVQTANFILMGNVSPARLAEISQLAEAERAKIVKLLKLDPAVPLVKGSLVVFVLKRQFDYSEFIRMVEGREAPRNAAGHASVKGSDLYACLTASVDNDDILPALVAEQIAGGFLLNFADMPPWFAAGAARAIAARVEPRSPLVKRWDAELQNLPATDSPDSFVAATVFDAELAARSYGFARTLLQKLPAFQSLVAHLVDGRNFEQAVTDVYRNNARTLVELWLRGKQRRG